jgi:hypothetical protein
MHMFGARAISRESVRLRLKENVLADDDADALGANPLGHRLLLRRCMCLVQLDNHRNARNHRWRRPPPRAPPPHPHVR